MKIAFLSVGPAKHSYIREGVEDFLTRIKRYVPLESIEVKAGGPSSEDRVGTKKTEAERILKRLDASDLVVAFDERGKSIDTKAFSAFLEETMSGLAAGKNRIVLIVGGPYGLDSSVIERADRVVSLSGFTLAGGVARLVLAEQVYRALTIIRGEPYSH